MIMFSTTDTHLCGELYVAMVPPRRFSSDVLGLKNPFPFSPDSLTRYLPLNHLGLGSGPMPAHKAFHLNPSPQPCLASQKQPWTQPSSYLYNPFSPALQPSSSPRTLHRCIPKKPLRDCVWSCPPDQKSLPYSSLGLATSLECCLDNMFKAGTVP